MNSNVAPYDSEAFAFSALPYAIFLCIFLIIMFLSYYLTPSATGYGTHEQLGLPPCGFLTITGYPCPSCGLTTSFAYFAHGNFSASVIVQPFGALLFLTLNGLAILAVWAIAKKIPFSGVMSSDYMEWGQYGMLFLLLMSWGYKIVIMKIL
ncbi:DUF2752 domain-containing protein [bacterium]|nr:DUF2752 domain-containing protein [bacterium]